MANDRLFIQCRYCKETIMLAKYYPGVVETSPDRDKFIENFIDIHFRCSPNACIDLNGDRCFDLFTESGCPPDKWKTLKFRQKESKMRSEKNNPSCSNCYHWKQLNQDADSFGECHRYPPIPRTGFWGRVLPMTVPIHLLTGPMDWCGEWKFNLERPKDETTAEESRKIWGEKGNKDETTG